MSVFYYHLNLYKMNQGGRGNGVIQINHSN